MPTAKSGGGDTLGWGWVEAGWHFQGRDMERNASCPCKELMIGRLRK